MSWTEQSPVARRTEQADSGGKACGSDLRQETDYSDWGWQNSPHFLHTGAGVVPSDGPLASNSLFAYHPTIRIYVFWNVENFVCIYNYMNAYINK
jgi:hypothetical protein